MSLLRAAPILLSWLIGSAGRKRPWYSRMPRKCRPSRYTSRSRMARYGPSPSGIRQSRPMTISARFGRRTAIVGMASLAAFRMCASSLRGPHYAVADHSDSLNRRDAQRPGQVAGLFVLAYQQCLLVPSQRPDWRVRPGAHVRGLLSAHRPRPGPLAQGAANTELRGDVPSNDKL